MPRILRIINRLNLGGPTWNVAYLTKFLEPEYETMLVAGMAEESESSSSFILDQYGIEPVYVEEMKRPLNPVLDRKAYKKIKKIVRDFKPDIVHTHAAKSGTLGRLAALACDVPVILHTFHGHVFHSYFHPVKTRLFLEIERYLAKRSQTIIAISDIQKEELANQFKVCDGSKIDVVPLGFDLRKYTEDMDIKRSKFRTQYKVKEDEIAIGIIGRLVPVKNHELFLRAFKKLLQQTQKPVRAFVIGDGELRDSLQMKANELQIPFSLNGMRNESPLMFTSWIREVDVANAGLDIVALTSLNEGTPVSLIEAQAAGNPVVSTRVGGISDVVIEGESALLSDVNDVDGFARHLIQLVEDNALRKRMSNMGQTFVMEHFNYNRLVKDMAGVYDKLLNNARVTTTARSDVEYEQI
jgi:glycosyltransferase involved in cell wall biosynthesis